MTPDQFLAKMRLAGVLLGPHIPVYGEKISTHLASGIDHITSPDTGEEWLHAPLLRLFDRARDILGRPIPVTAGSRTPAHEANLQAAGLKTAKFVSPHCLSALDCDAKPLPNLPEAANNVEIQKALKAAAHDLGFDTPRLGHKAYNEKFTHVDVVFMFFAPFTTLAHPVDWPELDDAQKKLVASWRPGVEW